MTKARGGRDLIEPVQRPTVLVGAMPTDPAALRPLPDPLRRDRVLGLAETVEQPLPRVPVGEVIGLQDDGLRVVDVVLRPRIFGSVSHSSIVAQIRAASRYDAGGSVSLNGGGLERKRSLGVGLVTGTSRSKSASAASGDASRIAISTRRSQAAQNGLLGRRGCPHEHRSSRIGMHPRSALGEAAQVTDFDAGRADELAGRSERVRLGGGFEVAAPWPDDPGRPVIRRGHSDHRLSAQPLIVMCMALSAAIINQTAIHGGRSSW